jgi:hypothetical protein
MQQGQPARLMRIHISESDRFGDRPLYEAIVARCREMNIAGATVLRGLEGYGETAEMHKSHLTRRGPSSSRLWIRPITWRGWLRWSKR